MQNIAEGLAAQRGSGSHRHYTRSAPLGATNSETPGGRAHRALRGTLGTNSKAPKRLSGVPAGALSPRGPNLLTTPQFEAEPAVNRLTDLHLAQVAHKKIPDRFTAWQAVLRFHSGPDRGAGTWHLHVRAE